MDLPFTMADLYYSLRRIRTGRAPGADNLPMQTLRLLLHPVKHKFLSHYINTVFKMELLRAEPF